MHKPNPTYHTPNKVKTHQKPLKPPTKAQHKTKETRKTANPKFNKSYKQRETLTTNLNTRTHPYNEPKTQGLPKAYKITKPTQTKTKLKYETHHQNPPTPKQLLPNQNTPRHRKWDQTHPRPQHLKHQPIPKSGIKPLQATNPETKQKQMSQAKQKQNALNKPKHAAQATILYHKKPPTKITSPTTLNVHNKSR